MKEFVVKVEGEERGGALGVGADEGVKCKSGGCGWKMGEEVVGIEERLRGFVRKGEGVDEGVEGRRVGEEAAGEEVGEELVDLGEGCG